MKMVSHMFVVDASLRRSSKSVYYIRRTKIKHININIFGAMRCINIMRHYYRMKFNNTDTSK